MIYQQNYLLKWAPMNLILELYLWTTSSGFNVNKFTTSANGNDLETCNRNTTVFLIHTRVNWQIMSYLIFDFSTTKLCKSSISELMILEIGKNRGRSTNLPFPKLPKTSKSENFVHTLSWVSHSLFYLFHSWVYGMKLTEWARRDHDNSQAVLTQTNIFTVFYITQG